MNANVLLSKLGLVCTAAVISGLMVATPAQAGGGQNKVTHAPIAFPTSAPAPLAKAQPKVAPKAPEIQVAVMATAPAHPTTRRSVFIHR